MIGKLLHDWSHLGLYMWRQLWGVLTEQYEMEYVEHDKQFPLAEVMKDMGPVWEEIVRENGLSAIKLEQVANWGFADAILGLQGTVDNMNKSKEHGFLGFRNTKNSFIYCIDKMRASKIVP